MSAAMQGDIGVPGPRETDQADAARLAALVRECVTADIPRRAVVVHLSRLPWSLSRPHHRRLARAALGPLVNADRARLFVLANQDLAVVWRGPASLACGESRQEIELLFTDDTPGAPVVAELWEEFDLPADAERLLALAEGEVPEPGAPLPSMPALDTIALADLETRLAQADVARFARRRQICARMPDGRFQLRWERRFLSVRELFESLAPDHAPRADSWLFRRLTRTLDRRMLALLAAPAELADAGPFSLNLNIASILAPEFLRFDAALPAALRGRVTLDLLPADILADPAAFLFARDFTAARGYRLLLRGMTPDLLAMFPRERVGLDWLQLRWSPDLAMLGPAAMVDASHMVLAHAASPAAIAWGTACGIKLFQGDAAMPSRRPRHDS